MLASTPIVPNTRTQICWEACKKSRHRKCAVMRAPITPVAFYHPLQSSETTTSDSIPSAISKQESSSVSQKWTCPDGNVQRTSTWAGIRLIWFYSSAASYVHSRQAQAYLPDELLLPFKEKKERKELKLHECRQLHEHGKSNFRR